MNHIKRVEGDNYQLNLWSDAPYEIRTDDIKRLIICTADNLDLELQIDARYCRRRRDWTISFRWRSENGLGWIGCDKQIDPDQLSRTYPEIIAGEFCYEIRRSRSDAYGGQGSDHRRLNPPDDSQNWVIVRYREEHFAKIHQTGKRSINLILYEVTQEGDLTTNLTTVTIRARIPSDAIRRYDGVEIGGMLLQGELLGWVEDGQEGWFLFSPNTQQVNTSVSSPDEIRITFTTRPRTDRRACMGRIRRMFEQGQIELPRSGYFDQYLMDYPDRPERVRLEIPRQHPQFSEPPRDSFQLLEGRFEVARDADIYPRINATNAIGDTTCQYNARSRMIRCAVNPCGPCEGCQHYEKI